MPIYLGGGLVALAILGVILAIAALSNREEPTTAGSPTPSPSGQAPGTTPTPPQGAVTPIPSTPTPSVTPSATATVEPSPTETATVDPDPTETPTADPPENSGTFGGWTGNDGDYTIIIESADTLEGAETVAQQAQDKGLTVGILDSNDYSTLRDGYQVVFTGTFSSEADAEAELSTVKQDYSDAYIKRVKT